MNNESKSERFKRIAENRTQKIIDMIELLGNCSNRNNYEYTEADVRKIVKAIEGELTLMKSKFEINLQKNNNQFKL